MSGVLAGLIGSFAKVPFVATGGSSTLTQNGWRYHIFNSSGTFTVSSGESTLQILTINGGAGGGTSYRSGNTIYGGNGGNGGEALIGATVAPVSTSFTVTVGGGGGQSSVTPTRSTTSISGGGGGLGAAIGGSGRSATLGGSVSLYNTRGVPWSLLTLNQAANAGGGGGDAGYFDLAFYGYYNQGSSNGGLSGYNTNVGSTGWGGSVGSSGGSASANTGGGGGGGGVYGEGSYGSIEVVQTRSGGFGGSGIVIIAYPVA